MAEKQKKHEPFGLHLMLEGYDCDPQTLSDANHIYKILDELPEKIGMHKLTRPYIVHTDGNHEKDPGGWSGFIIINESHISLHTFVKRKFVTADVYSCNQFDTEIVIAYLKEAFKTTNVEYDIVTRGKHYPSKNLI